MSASGSDLGKISEERRFQGCRSRAVLEATVLPAKKGLMALFPRTSRTEDHQAPSTLPISPAPQAWELATSDPTIHRLF